MKVEIKESLEKTTLEYSKLMISNQGKLIFLAEEGLGFRMDNEYQYSNIWYVDGFKDFKGTFTITQE